MNTGATGVQFKGVHGTGPADVYVVGDQGTILHYDGKSWTKQTSGNTDTLNGVWAAGAKDVFVVGSDGTILHARTCSHPTRGRRASGGNIGRMRSLLTLSVALLVTGRAPASADEIEHVGYHVEGLTADGKYAAFRKEASGGEQPCRDVSLVIWQVTPAKQVDSASIFRAGPGCSAPLGKAAGLRERTRLATRYGDFVPRTRLEPKPGGLSGGGLSLLLDVVAIFPALDPGNPAANAKRRVPVRLQLTAERGGVSRVLIKKDIKVAPVLAPGSDKHFVWRKPELAEGQVSTDGKVVAVILDEKPAVFVLSGLGSPR